MIMNLIDFGYAVLESENIHDFKINIVDGNEALCLKESKTINIGRNAIAQEDRKLMLHEIAHVLTDNNHYSEEFLNIYKELVKKYV